MSTPALAFDNINSSGEFGLYFNGDLAGLKFLEKINKGLGSYGTVKDFGYRQLEDT